MALVGGAIGWGVRGAGGGDLYVEAYLLQEMTPSRTLIKQKQIEHNTY